MAAAVNCAVRTPLRHTGETTRRRAGGADCARWRWRRRVQRARRRGTAGANKCARRGCVAVSQTAVGDQLPQWRAEHRGECEGEQLQVCLGKFHLFRTSQCGIHCCTRCNKGYLKGEGGHNQPPALFGRLQIRPETWLAARPLPNGRPAAGRVIGFTSGRFALARVEVHRRRRRRRRLHRRRRHPKLL